MLLANYLFRNSPSWHRRYLCHSHRVLLFPQVCEGTTDGWRKRNDRVEKVEIQDVHSKEEAMDPMNCSCENADLRQWKGPYEWTTEYGFILFRMYSCSHR